MEKYNKTVVKHSIKRKGVEVMYNNESKENRIWISFGSNYGWHKQEDAMQLVKTILKMRSDLKKVGIKL